MKIIPFILVLIWSTTLGSVAEEPRDTKKKVYLEHFDRGPGGWFADRHYALPVWNGVAYCYGPWFLDANHAPPGAGYLHLVMWLYTTGKRYPLARQIGLPYTDNPFVEKAYSTNFTHAKVSVRLRGEVDLKGAQLLLLIQGETSRTTANFVLTGQPFRISREWTEQTITLTPDPTQWTCMGARHDMGHTYGCADIADVLKDVNVDIIFVLHPLEVKPACGEIHDKHRLWAGKDYPVDYHALPKGLIMFDYVKIEFAQ